MHRGQCGGQGGSENPGEVQLQAGAEGPASRGAAITSNRFGKLCLVGGTARAWGVETAPGNKPPMGLWVSAVKTALYFLS